MELKQACADFTFPLLPHCDALDVIARLGVKGVDIGLFRERSHIRPENVFNDIAGSARQLSLQIRDRGLEIADIFLQASTDFQSVAVNHPDANVRKQSREAFRKGLEFVARCNATHMTGLPGVNFEGESPADSLDRCASELAWRVDQAKAVGIVFSVEAHLGSLAPAPEIAAKLVEKTPGLTLTLDYGHFTYQGIADSVVEPLMAHASHFHARCARPKRLQAPLKDNAIDYAAILRAMKRTNYSGWVGLEYVWVDWEHCNEVDNLSETILLRDHLREVTS
jgi:sugar phosphate isomerase/epimerase